MKQRFLMWGLASMAFVVTLAVSSWNEGLWFADEPPIRGSRPATLASADPIPLPAEPYGPIKPATVATSTVTAATPPQPQALQQTEPPAPAEQLALPMPVAEAEVDTPHFLSRRDRASQHSSRAR
jgi:hypothetical protein